MSYAEPLDPTKSVWSDTFLRYTSPVFPAFEMVRMNFVFITCFICFIGIRIVKMLDYVLLILLFILLCINFKLF